MRPQDAERYAADLDSAIMEFVRQGTKYARRRGSLTRSQLFLMRVLGCGGAKRTSELAEELDITSPAVTGLVKELEKASYVARTEDPDDRRVTLVELTPKGRRVFEKAQQKRRRRAVEVLRQFDPAEIEAFLATLRKMQRLVYPYDE